MTRILLALVLLFPGVAGAAQQLPCATLAFAVEKITANGGEVLTVLSVPNTPSGGVLVYRFGDDVYVAAMTSTDCVSFEGYSVGAFVASTGV